MVIGGGADPVDAGGAAFLATHVNTLESQAKNSILLSACDDIGASPLVSALSHDELTIEFLGDIGLDASVVGNHDFDEGYAELKRIQLGGVPPDGRLPVPTQVHGGEVEGLKFGDEVQAINRTANLLDRLGIKTLIVTMHQGDATDVGSPQACNLKPGGIAHEIATTATPKVDAFFTGHSHQQYNCSVNDPAGNPRPVIQGLSFGRLLSVIDVKIDRKTRDVIRSSTVAQNVIVTRDVTPDPVVQHVVDDAVALSAPVGNRPVGNSTADITRAAPLSGEGPLGDVIADAQLAATTSNGAQIAITNPGGIRTDLIFAPSGAEGAGVVTYAEAFAVQPFSNIMQTITLTGAQLDAVLEQQWQPTTPVTVRILQISASLHYSQTLSRPIGDRVSNITVNGVAVTPTATYRVSVNNFLAAGGDGFTVFAQGTDLAGGPIDLDAFTAYLTAHPNLAPPPADRVTVIG